MAVFESEVYEHKHLSRKVLDLITVSEATHWQEA